MLAIGALLVPGFFVPRLSLLFVHLSLFVAGILTFQFKAGRLSKRSFLAALALKFTVTGFGQGPVIAVTCAGTALVIAFVEFGGRMLTWLGMIRYSLHLMHVPIGGKIIDMGARFTHGVIGASVALAAATGGAILAGWVSYRVLELPSQRWSSRISYRRKAEHEAEDSVACIADA